MIRDDQFAHYVLQDFLELSYRFGFDMEPFDVAHGIKKPAFPRPIQLSPYMRVFETSFPSIALFVLPVSKFQAMLL